METLLGLFYSSGCCSKLKKILSNLCLNDQTLIPFYYIECNYGLIIIRIQNTDSHCRFKQNKEFIYNQSLNEFFTK